jgi:hypothetical protein
MNVWRSHIVMLTTPENYKIGILKNTKQNIIVFYISLWF